MLADYSCGNSSRVAIRLELENAVLEVAAVSRDSLILKEPYEAAPTSSARIVITVEGREFPHAVSLHQGIRKDTRTVRFG